MITRSVNGGFVYTLYMDYTGINTFQYIATGGDFEFPWTWVTITVGATQTPEFPTAAIPVLCVCAFVLIIMEFLYRKYNDSFF